jgi:hypothetical protein
MRALALSALLLCGLFASGHARTDPQKAKAIAKNVADVTSRTGVNWITTSQLRVGARRGTAAGAGRAAPRRATHALPRSQAMDLTKNTRPIMYFFNWRT